MVRQQAAMKGRKRQGRKGVNAILEQWVVACLWACIFDCLSFS
jgi:hypothetical protein